MYVPGFDIDSSDRRFRHREGAGVETAKVLPDPTQEQTLLLTRADAA